MAVGRYRDPATGQYVNLGGDKNEVQVSATEPTDPNVDVWIDPVNDPPASITTSHNSLAQRDAATAHPTSAITGLDSQLASLSSQIVSLNGFRNAIRNGDMQVAQRGNGPFSANAYAVDGWLHEFSSGTATTTRAVQGLGLGSPHLVTAISGQSGATAYCLVYQKIEDVATLSGQTVTISFNAKAASGTPRIGLAFEQFFGTGGGSTGVSTALGKVTISTTMQRYSLTTTVPSVIGKTRGTGNNDCIYLEFWYSLSTAYDYFSPGLGIQTNTFYMTDVQLETGSVATTFERLPQQMQLAWCQRYFQRWQQPPLRGVIESGYASRVAFPLPVTMRVAPVATISGVLNYWDGAAGIAGTTINASYNTPMACEINLGPGGLTTGRGAVIYQAGTGYLDLSAEL